MRIRESRIRRIIQEEAQRSLVEMRGPAGPAGVFEAIREICDEALMNKSLGINPRIANNYEQQVKDELRKLHGYQDLGGDTEWDQDKHGFGGAMRRSRRD